MTKSTHVVEVVPVTLERHPNADTLSIVKVYGYSCVVRTADWQNKTIGAYIPPDSICPKTPEYAFLDKMLGPERIIRTIRLRGVLSLGLLMPAPEGSKIGDNVADIMGIQHYEVPPEEMNAHATTGPRGIYSPTYDIDTIRKFNNLFTPGELVYVTEKIHGECCRFTYHDDEMFVGSREEWQKQTEDNKWWTLLSPEIEAFCRANPSYILFGEAYGNKKKFHYGADVLPDNKRLRFIAFDILKGTEWATPDEFVSLCAFHDIPHVPVLAWKMPFNFAEIEKLAEGHSILSRQWGEENVREGCVVKPMTEQVCLEIGRKVLKLVGNGYYAK